MKIEIKNIKFEQTLDLKSRVTALVAKSGIGKTITLDSIEKHLILENVKYYYKRQENYLLEYLTVNEYILLIAELKNYHIEEIYSKLKLFDLIDKQDSLISELSGGEKQRLSLAFTFVNDAKIILLDEPSNFPGKYYTDILVAIISESNDIKIVMSTHDEYILKCVDEIINLEAWINE